MSLTGLISSSARALGNRFTLVTILPTTIFALIMAGLYRGGAFTGRPSLHDMLALPTSANSLIGLTSAILVLSVVIQPFQIGLVRVLEGYWGGSRPMLMLASVGVEIQRRRRQRLYRLQPLDRDGGDARGALSDEIRHARSQLKLFPAKQRLLPTRLGNALRAYEDTAGERYGLSTVVTYPRLYPVVSDRLRLSLGQFIDQLDTAAGLTISFLLATVVSAAILIDDGWWLIIPFGTGCLAVVSYRGAIRAASYQGELLATAFDLHRFDLLAALHLPLPRTPIEEHRDNRELSSFLDEQRADSRDYRFIYRHPSSEKTSPNRVRSRMR